MMKKILYKPRNEYFEVHPLYSALPYHQIVGLIQLLIDNKFLSPTVNNSWYIEFKDFRHLANKFYIQLTIPDKFELIEYLKYKSYLQGE